MTDAHLARGRLLLEQRRPDLAEPELRRALAERPDDAVVHVLLAFCLVQLGRPDDALVAADRARGLEPEWDEPHRARAWALHVSGRLRDAEAAIREALALDPEEASSHGVLAGILADQKRWRESLEAAEVGLRLDPADTDCANSRAFALIQLGEGADADLALAAALQRDPDNALTHQSLGWAALHRGRAGDAVRHYREALRLDPTSDAARAGLVEALNARNPVYRLFLRWSLLLTRIPTRTAVLLMVGSVLARRLIAGVADASPALAPVLWPVFWILVVFMLLTWIAQPLFNLLLRVDREGRHALSDRQRRQTDWLLAALVSVALAGALWAAGVPAMGAAFVCAAVLVIPITAAAGSQGRLGRMLAGGAVGLALVAATIVWRSWDQDRWSSRAAPYVQRLRGLDQTQCAAEVATWSAEERAELVELEEAVAALSARQDADERYVVVLALGFVAFTWVAGMGGALGRRG